MKISKKLLHTKIISFSKPDFHKSTFRLQFFLFGKFTQVDIIFNPGREKGKKSILERQRSQYPTPTV